VIPNCLAAEGGCDLSKLLETHIRQGIVANDCPGVSWQALDDIARRSLEGFIAIYAFFSSRTGSQWPLYLLSCRRWAVGKNRNQIQTDGFIRLVVAVEKLLKDLDRVWAVPSPSSRDTGSAQFIIFFGEVWNAVSPLANEQAL
jgi:hypothetical protein